MVNEPVEIAIIGAGPIGIELAVRLKQKSITYRHFEAQQIGSTIAWYAPGTQFFSSAERISIAGVPLVNTLQTKPTREEYLAYLRMVVAQFDLEIDTYTPVQGISKSPEGFELDLGSGRSARARRLALCIGDMHAPNEIGVPGEDLPHVSHYFAEVHQYFRKQVLIYGGKNSAVEAAVRLVRLGAKVTLSHRAAELDAKRIKYWLYPEIMHYVKSGAMTYLPAARLVKIGDSAATLTLAAEPKTVSADFVLLLTGYRQNKALFNALGVELAGAAEAPVFNSETMETNVANVYVAGTAVAGTQTGGVTEFIETSHVHVDRIVAALTGEKPPQISVRDKNDLES